MRSNAKRIAGVLAWIGCLAGSGSAAAQEGEVHEYVPGALEVEEAPPPVPWDYFLRIGLGFSLGSSTNVIGNADGNTWTVSLALEASADYNRNNHEVRNTLLIGEAFTQTPVVDEFVKTNDQLSLESIYLYHIPSAPWIGPFARFELLTSIFAGQDVRAADVTYAITRVDGTIDSVLASQLDTTDPFLPLSLKESVGLFIRPETEPTFQFETLFGFGSRQVFADDQLAVNDVDTTPEIEVVELESFVQAGAELVATIWGAIAESRFGYRAGAEFLVPFINDLPDEDERTAFELTNIDVFAGLTLQIVEWASLEYQFHTLKVPQLLDEFQTTHLLLFTLGYTVIDTRAQRAAAEAEAAAIAEAAAAAQTEGEEAAEEVEEETPPPAEEP